MTDEEVVRAAWDKVRVEQDFGFHFWFSGRNALYLFVEEQNSWPIAWSEARKLTEANAEKIRQVREEISELWVIIDTTAEGVAKQAFIRTEKRLQSVLDDLLKGWRQ